MPRGPRLDAPGVLQHVMARGIERRKLFLDNHDRIWGQIWGQANLNDLFGRLPFLRELQSLSTTICRSPSFLISSDSFDNPLLNTAES